MRGQQEEQYERYAQPGVQHRAIKERDPGLQSDRTENKEFTETEHSLGVMSKDIKKNRFGKSHLTS